METKDIGQIRIGSAAFTAKWWKDRRSIVTKGCGVAKALDAWQADCPKDPEKITGSGPAESARTAAWGVIQAMTKAKAKCGKLQKETADACDVYIKLAKAYHGKIGAKAVNSSADAAQLGRMAEVMDKALEMAGKAEARAKVAAEKVNKTASLIATIVAGVEAGKMSPKAAAEQSVRLEKILVGATGGLKEADKAGGLRNQARKMADELKTPAAMKSFKGFEAKFDRKLAVLAYVDETREKARRSLEGLRGRVAVAETDMRKLRDQLEDLKDVAFDQLPGSVADVIRDFSRVNQRCVEIIRLKGTDPTTDELRSARDGLNAAKATMGNVGPQVKSAEKALVRFLAAAKGHEDMVSQDGRTPFRRWVDEGKKDWPKLKAAMTTAAKAIKLAEKELVILLRVAKAA